MVRFRRTPRGAPDASARTTVDEAAGPPVVEEEYAPPPPPRGPILWPWLLLLLLLVAGGLAAAYFLTRDDDEKQATATVATVPRVVGLKQNAAVRRLNERGLTPQIVTRRSTFSAGTVFAQDPAAGAEVARRSPVTISVSAVSVTAVPSVVGTRTAIAVQRLRAAGLGSQVTSVAAKAPAGVVVAQAPKAGTTVARNSTVSLRVSKGQARVPDVVGQPVTDARAALRAAGLVPAVFRVPGPEPKGTVTAQKPLAGKTVSRGSQVRINVSSGPGATGPTTTASGAVTVPDVVGQTQQEATATLREAGFRVRATTVDTGDASQNGTVVDEQPAAGTRAPQGSVVTISVNRTA